MTNKTETKRFRIAEKLADHLLSHGLEGASLRQLAKAVGTSDRMLLHYFENKDELMSMTLAVIADRFLLVLDNAQIGCVPYMERIASLSMMIGNADIRPYLRLWLELAASAVRGSKIYRDIANRIFRNYFNWVAVSLDVEREEDRIPLASLVVATVEGFVLMDAFGAASHIANALKGLDVR